MRRITVDERRARLARRHGFAPGHRPADVVDAARRMVCLHATDPATIFLSARARVAGMQVADLERGLYADRTLVKHLAMRRTLFVFPRDTLADAHAAASVLVAARERARLIAAIERSGTRRNGARWLATVSAQVLDALAAREMSFAELRDALPLMQTTIVSTGDKPWDGPIPIGPRVLTQLSAEGRIARATNDGAWTISRPRWTATPAWLGAPIEPRAAAAATAALVARWLYAFGPGTEADIKWWLGSTLTAVRRALADVGAVAVDLDGRTGYLLPDDVDDPGPVDPWIALLPGLDPTPMGWTERAWYLGPHKPQVFDRNGNVGPTIWCDGRIVGGWRQRRGTVEVQWLEAVSAAARRAVESEASELGRWLAGAKITPRFPSPLSQIAD